MNHTARLSAAIVAMNMIVTTTTSRGENSTGEVRWAGLGNILTRRSIEFAFRHELASNQCGPGDAENRQYPLERSERTVPTAEIFSKRPNVVLETRDLAPRLTTRCLFVIFRSFFFLERFPGNRGHAEPERPGHLRRSY